MTPRIDLNKLVLGTVKFYCLSLLHHHYYCVMMMIMVMMKMIPCSYAFAQQRVLLVHYLKPAHKC